MSTNKYYKISKAAERLGVSIPTLRRWEADGSITAIRTPGGQRMLDISSMCHDTLIKNKTKQSNKTIVYGRVSSSKQKDDLERQREFLFDNPAVRKARPEDVIAITDVGSGLNFKRPGLLRILGLVKDGGVSKIVVASRDRLARFGFELIEWLCNEYGTQILVLDQEDSTPEEELGKDLMSIVQVYCCRWNGRRRYTKTTKELPVETQTFLPPEGDSQPMGRMLQIHLQQSDSPVVDEKNKYTQIPDLLAEQTSDKKDTWKNTDKQFPRRKEMVGKLSDGNPKESRKRGEKQS